ncbi:phosphatidylethanolamine N-methyltransferase family protein [Actinotalea sp. M2MS4P-6]|uniref:phosphatidylethanolamine N-methyltransferase family protein n=1 Tax=Actinotalea sp. M2MS4P-6 TaxID=2983762 RepID=UPI0021E48FFC|nr:phosphatidylethanolamine N-methyltransferase family protein [Actinotalea sp. M2MS4P-6]MCV2393111.1 phosphatidylethanolamine N-methyltransferase family protein [Actinotalea sp. M2MS4P-6]
MTAGPNRPERPDPHVRPLRYSDGLSLQLGASAVLVVLGWWVADPTGSWLGLSGATWLAAAFAVPVVHQLYVWAAWRSELLHRTWTRRFGDRALRVFGLGFFVLFALRPVTMVGLAVADRGTLWTPGPVSWVAAALLAAPAVWTLASVVLFFGARRALGVDHFVPGFDEPFVRRGAFAHVPNAMYTLAFLLLWAIAVAAGSRAALVAAAVQHALIWVHYVATERPDMQVIYGGRPLSSSPPR